MPTPIKPKTVAELLAGAECPEYFEEDVIRPAFDRPDDPACELTPEEEEQWYNAMMLDNDD